MSPWSAIYSEVLPGVGCEQRAKWLGTWAPDPDRMSLLTGGVMLGKLLELSVPRFLLL